MNKLWLLLPALLLCILFGCSGKTELDGRLLNYDLGSGMLNTGDGREIPYEIQGVLGIPDGKDCPIVVLLHGSHPIEKASEDRYDVGFNYLAQALSEQGNLVIAMNIGINFSFEDGEPIANERTRQVFHKQMELLKKAVDGDKSVFGYDLSGVGDFSKVVMVGHSRSGLDALEIAALEAGNMTISGIVSVAPSMYKVLETEIPDVPIGIILPSLDGDVISMDGNDIYELIADDKTRSSAAELIYLKYANHGQFNTQLTSPDLNHGDKNPDNLMSADTQRSFLAAYLSDFVGSVTKTRNTVFSEEAFLDTAAYGCDVLLRLSSGGEILYSAENSPAPLVFGGASTEKLIASFYPEKNTVGPFKIPGGSAFESYALQRIVWSGIGSGAQLAISGNLDGYRFLDIDMAIDSSDPRNIDGQEMTIRLKGISDNVAEFKVDRKSGALLWQEGELKEEIGWDEKPSLEYSVFTPLVTLRLDLLELEAAELSGVTGIELSFPQSQKGSLMLRSISGVK